MLYTITVRKTAINDFLKVTCAKHISYYIYQYKKLFRNYFNLYELQLITL